MSVCEMATRDGPRDYAVMEMDVDDATTYYAVARLDKERAPYIVSAGEKPHCTCKGWKYHGHCKHINAVNAAREK